MRRCGLTTSTFYILKADPTLGRAEALRRAILAYINDIRATPTPLIRRRPWSSARCGKVTERSALP
jgi:hypothetical protein